jgi:hypothetical protein
MVVPLPKAFVTAADVPDTETVWLVMILSGSINDVLQ